MEDSSRKRRKVDKGEQKLAERGSHNTEVDVNKPTCISEAVNYNPDQFLKGEKIFVLSTGIGKARCDIFRKQVLKNGGEYHEKLTSETLKIIVDEKMEIDRMCRILKLDAPPNGMKVVKSLWLSNCLKHKINLDTSDYELSLMKYTQLKTASNDSSNDVFPQDKKSNSPPVCKVEEEKPSTSAVATKSYEPAEKSCDSKTVDNTPLPKVEMMFDANRKRRPEGGDSDSDYVPSDEEDKEINSATSTPTTSPHRPIPKGNWVCAEASGSKKISFNHGIIEKLEQMVKAYENTNDKWRAFGYQKAIMALRKYPKEVTTWEEAKALPGVGQRLADKIWEIVESGELRKLDEITSSEEMKVLELFKNIWGAGAHTARTWYQQGMRTLDDLKTKATLTRQQKIGLRLYDDLLDRMPRSEATEIEKVVRAAVNEIDPGLVAMACGSFRRGKATCGDVDVLITHPDGKSHRGVFHLILNKLKQTGFLTDDLVTIEDNGNQKKYLGVCKLPGHESKHRRLDIIVVPYDEYACALMYFTGSAHFNRSMRNLAGKMGMSLNEHSLNTGVVRKGRDKIGKGTPLPTPTEESVFKHLGLEYRRPEQRDH